MKRAAIGVRMHSGWGALVAVSMSAGVVEVIIRRRIAITTPGIAGANQPYHFAEKLELSEAEQFLLSYFAASQCLATSCVAAVLAELKAGHFRVVGASVLLASGRPLPPLSKILQSHALIHAAEGEFFREVFSKVCESLELDVLRLRERDLDEQVQAMFGNQAVGLLQQVSRLGNLLGPPWTRDQKTATLAAMAVLALKRR